jgi:hypothetical protein
MPGLSVCIKWDVIVLVSLPSKDKTCENKLVSCE